jgi:hypothetical protein
MKKGLFSLARLASRSASVGPSLLSASWPRRWALLGSRAPASAAHQVGLSLREVAEISGHRSLAALERYLDQDFACDKAEAARGLLVGC